MNSYSSIKYFYYVIIFFLFVMWHKYLIQIGLEWHERKHLDSCNSTALRQSFFIIVNILSTFLRCPRSLHHSPCTLSSFVHTLSLLPLLFHPTPDGETDISLTLNQYKKLETLTFWKSQWWYHLFLLFAELFPHFSSLFRDFGDRDPWVLRFDAVSTGIQPQHVGAHWSLWGVDVLYLFLHISTQTRYDGIVHLYIYDWYDDQNILKTQIN